MINSNFLLLLTAYLFITFSILGYGLFFERIYEKKTIGWFPITKFKNDRNTATLRPHYQEHIKSIVKNDQFIIKQIEQLENY